MNIIELAKKAGLKAGTNISGVTLVGSPSTPGIAHISIDEMERVADLVLEEAAKVCDKRYMGDNNREDLEARRCAAAIRALKGAKE